MIPIIGWKTAAVAAVGAVVAVGGVSVILPWIGFGAAGVKAASVAATYQSTIGNVAASSFFAGLQSAGAAGLAGKTVAAVGAAGAATATACKKVYEWSKK